jgi:hypothetical protein
MISVSIQNHAYHGSANQVFCSALVSLLFSLLLTNAQQTPLRGKEAASPLQPFSLAKQEAIHSAVSEEERTNFSHLFDVKDETDESRSVTEEVQ